MDEVKQALIKLKSLLCNPDRWVSDQESITPNKDTLLSGMYKICKDDKALLNKVHNALYLEVLKLNKFFNIEIFNKRKSHVDIITLIDSAIANCK